MLKRFLSVLLLALAVGAWTMPLVLSGCDDDEVKIESDDNGLEVDVDD